MLHHVADRTEWDHAVAEGVYLGSTRGVAFAEQGFVHLCTADQLPGVLERFYAGVADLLVLDVDESTFGDDLRWEPAPDTGERFPHLYTPLPITSVVGSRPIS